MEKLIQALLTPTPWPHPVTDIELRETHISWVLLTGDYAYKIKKPVNFGFLDFSTLQLRRECCRQELRLNRRLAPKIYLDVAPICGTLEQPEVGGSGDAIEWAVLMRQFDERQLLSAMAAEQRLLPGHIDAMARTVAEFHRRLPPSDPESPWGEPERVHHWVRENFSHILASVAGTRRAASVEQLRRDCETMFEASRGMLAQRRQRGFVRECHGDLHLGNMAWLEGRLVPFDCIEFNPELRWIDVMSEVAFVFMDLEDRGYPAFAWRFLNRYLALTGDYDGLRVLRYYLVYRALVRAKVALLRRGEEDEGDPAREALWQEFRGYADLAARELVRRRPVLIITHGLSGSGKSTLAAPLAERLGALHVRSDIERKRLFGLAADAKSNSAVDGGIYTADAGRQTYDRLHTIAATALEAGCPVLVDATFLECERREQFRKLAADSGAQFLILHCHAPSAVLEERVRRRQRLGADPSEAGLRVLRSQLDNQQPLTKEELEHSLRIDTGKCETGAELADGLLADIRRRLPGL